MFRGKKVRLRAYRSGEVKRVLDLLEEEDIHKIKLTYYEFNEAGKRCYEAVGFKEEGRNRKELYRHGRYYDTLNMGLFQEELK